MTKDQLTRLWDELVEFQAWMDDKPLQLSLFGALVVVRRAIWAEREDLADAEVGR